jgi:hypothetical protein
MAEISGPAPGVKPPTGIQTMPNEMIMSHVYGGSPEPCKVKLEKNTKGFNYELSISGPDFACCIKAIEEAKAIMEAKYGVQ